MDAHLHRMNTLKYLISRRNLINTQKLAINSRFYFEESGEKIRYAYKCTINLHAEP